MVFLHAIIQPQKNTYQNANREMNGAVGAEQDEPRDYRMDDNETIGDFIERNEIVR